MSLRGLSKEEFETTVNRFRRVAPLVEEPPTFKEKIWNDLRIWDDRYVWDE